MLGNFGGGGTKLGWGGEEGEEVLWYELSMVDEGRLM